MNAPNPAVIFCDPVIGSLPVASLTLLDRLVVAIHRAGCSPVTVICDGPLPALRRTRALGIRVTLQKEWESTAGPALLAECSLVATPEDLRRTIACRGRLADAHGHPLPIGLVSDASARRDCEFSGLPAIRAEGVAMAVTDAASANRAGEALWNSLTSPTDGVVDQYFNRPLGRYLSKALVHTSITPNQVTMGSTLIGLAGAWCFSRGTYGAGIVGALLLQLSALVDCVDGEVARIAFKESPLGKWLDICLDQVVHVAVFASIALGLSRQHTDTPVLWLGASAVGGALIAFPIVLRARRLAGNSRLERFLDKASTRDFTALLIGLAVFGRLDWFLWLTAVTVHIFWVSALWLQVPWRSPLVTSRASE